MTCAAASGSRLFDDEKRWRKHRRVDVSMALPDIEPVHISSLCVGDNVKLENIPFAAATQRIPMVPGKERKRNIKSLSGSSSRLTLVISSGVWDQPLPLQRQQFHSDTLMWPQKGCVWDKPDSPWAADTEARASEVM